MADSIHVTTEQGVARIVLASPQTRNVLDLATVRGLADAIRAAQEDEGCRVIVLAAEGPDFCAGLDLEAAVSATMPWEDEPARAFLDCLSLACDSPLPVIAQVEGDVTAGGMGLVAACDLVIAAPGAQFILSECIVGLIPALIAPFLLRRMPMGRLRALALGTRKIGASEAQAIGLVDEVAEGPIDVALDRQLQRLLRSSPPALAECKRYLDRLATADPAQWRPMADEQFLSWTRRPDVVASVRAFAEGFAPPWFQKYRGPRRV